MKKNYPIIGAIYKHYKGGLYKVLIMAKHSESNDDMVIYKSLHFGSYHARPLEKWNENVEILGFVMKRFELEKL